MGFLTSACTIYKIKIKLSINICEKNVGGRNNHVNNRFSLDQRRRQVFASILIEATKTSAIKSLFLS